MTLDRLTQQLDGKEVLLTEPRRARDTARANHDAALAQLGDAQARLRRSILRRRAQD